MSLFVKPSTLEEKHKFLKKLLDIEVPCEENLVFGSQLALEVKDWETAEALYKQLLNQRFHEEDLLGLSQALFKQSRFEEAEECLVEILRSLNEPSTILFLTYERLGQIAFKQKNYDLAEEYYNKAYTINSNATSLQFHQAFLKYKQGDFKQSESLFKSLLKTQPHISNAWLGLALVRRELGESEIAKACLNRALDLDSNNQVALKVKKSWTSSLEQKTELFSFLA